MLFAQTTAAEKRLQFKKSLKSGKLLQFPGAWAPIVSLQIEKNGFDGIYISGSVLSNDLAYPDIGLTTLTEVAQRGRQIARVSKLPTIIDADTGFGEPLNVTRTIQELIEAGLSACHLEDQENPKRCGHLDGKSLVSSERMVQKIKAATLGKKLDENFILIARTDARASEGLDAAITRAKMYLDAGADVIFTEALESENEFEKFRKEIKAPLLANMTEFGKTKLLSKTQLENLGYNIVIYPVTLFRIAVGATEKCLQDLAKNGTQEGSVPNMQTRKDLYELTRYEDYNQLDKNLFNFQLPKTK